MINTRRLVVSALGAVLLAAPLIRSQDAQRPEAKLIVTQPLALQVLELQPQRFADGWAAMMSDFGACHAHPGSFPLPGFSVWRNAPGNRETGRPGSF